MFAGRRKRRIAERRNLDFEIWIRRKLTILRRVESAFEVINFLTDVNASREFCRRFAVLTPLKLRQA